MKKFIPFFLFWLLLLLPLPRATAWAATIFVDGNNIYGANTSCTTYRVGVRDCVGGNATAYKTIALGTAALASGDTLNIRVGTYNEHVGNSLQTSQSGTASTAGWGTSSWNESGATIIQGYQGEIVSLNASGGTCLGFSTPSSGALRLFVFRHFKIDASNNCTGAGVGGGSNGGTVDHIKFDDIEVFGTTIYSPSAAAFGFGGESFPDRPDSTEIWLTNSSAHDSAPGQEEFHIHCWYIAFGNSIIEKSSCYNWHVGYAIHMNTGTFQPPNNVFRNLTMHDINASSTNLAAAVFYNGTGNTLQNSLIYDNDDGVGVHNNDHLSVINNTIFRNGVRAGHPGVNPAINFDNTNGAGRVAVNNIIYGNRDNSIANADATATNLTSNPGFVDTSSSPPNLQLSSTSSAAYNSGTNSPYCGPGTGVTTDFAGNLRLGTCDIGAYEYGTSGTVVITSPTTGPNYVTALNSVDVSGTAHCPTSVVSVTWTNSRGGNGVANGTTSWLASGIALTNNRVNDLTFTVNCQ